MKSATSFSRSLLRPYPTSTFLVVTAVIAIVVTTGCGSAGTSSSGTGPKLSGNTTVTVLLSSTANDQLSQFDLDIQGLTLTSQSGTSATVLAGDWQTEFIHENGGIEPVTTVTVPQGIYTAATATIGASGFTCVTVMPAQSDSPGSLDTSTYAYGYTPTANVTVNLPSPITITGDSMGLQLNLQVLQSASYPSTCYPTDFAPFSITPTFNLTPVTFAAVPTSPANGKVYELEGQVSALGSDASSFTLTLAETPTPQRTLSVNSNSNTVYQGIGNFSALQVGTFIDMDGAIQPDGSVLATRVGSYDPVALNEMIGPLVQLPASEQTLYSFPFGQQGQTYSVQGQDLGVYSYSDSTSFQISSQMNNLSSLPFVASFNSSNMVTGQNVAIFSQAITDYYGGQYTAATTMTLLPQTINGTVLLSAPSGSFTDYAVSLASYDLFPILAEQPGQTVRLNDPGTVEVYVDGNTQMLNAQALAPGNSLRFYGLVFNDGGTLRMDCAQVNDGVPFTTQSGSNGQFSNGQLKSGQTRTVERPSLGGTPRVISTTTQSH
ncbi:MAG TPA: DUF5666 domain-containing protein [Candidatus Sulfotelmatobacter sp.]